MKECPITRKEWNNAAKNKNCEKLSQRRNCSKETELQYHCLINSYLNDTVEVCAPREIILGIRFSLQKADKRKFANP